MTYDSQSVWEHCIPASPKPCGPRLSLTFRHHTAALPKRPIPPPICRPNPVDPPKTLSPKPQSSSTPIASPSRVLFLTDSIISNFPVDLFSKDIGCIKKRNFELFNIENYEKEFSYTDIVVLSCGINDLTRHQYTAHTLSQFIKQKLREYSVKFPNVIFVVNSLLYTTDPYFNREVSIYNREMFQFSLSVESVWFFDYLVDLTWQVLCRRW